MDPYSLKVIIDRKIAEDREWAARHRLAVEANRARREARQTAGSPVAVERPRSLCNVCEMSYSA